MQQKWNQNFDGEPMPDIPQKFLNAGCDVYMVMQLRHDEKILDERFASMRELMMLYNSGTRLGLIHELRLMQCYLMPDETALRELSEGVIEKLKLLTDAEFAELEFPLD